MFDWVYALVGFLIMFGVLVGIGINQPRGTSMKTWCYGYLAISIGFDILVILALLNASQYVWLNNLLLGLSAGAATGLGIHVAHHISEEDGHDENAKEKKILNVRFLKVENAAGEGFDPEKIFLWD